MQRNNLPTSQQNYRPSSEIQRTTEETERNDRRFDAYNFRLSRAGLPQQSLIEYYNRKHGQPSLDCRISQLEAQRALQVPHRDNIILLNR